MDERDIRLFAATALLSGNPALRGRAKTLVDAGADTELTDALRESLAREAVGGSVVLRVANLLPAPVLFVAQRVMLAYPRLARLILRRTGLHHQLY